MQVKNKLYLNGALSIISLVIISLMMIFSLISLSELGRSELQLSELNTSMLLLRRHEKDFLSRFDLKYQEKFAD